MISAYEIRKYTPEDKELWDTMVENSANGTFLFKRDYMEYHAQRFVDFSLMIYNKGKLVAILPASLHNSEIISHGGLTYGGFVSLASLSSIQLLDIFEATLNYFKRQGLAHWIYKPVPPHKIGCLPAACNRSMIARASAAYRATL